jgi:hypothetical protein
MAYGMLSQRSPAKWADWIFSPQGSKHKGNTLPGMLRAKRGKGFKTPDKEDSNTIVWLLRQGVDEAASCYF